MDVYIREAVTGLVLVMGIAVTLAVSSLLPSGLQVLWLMAAALALAFGKNPWRVRWSDGCWAIRRPWKNRKNAWEAPCEA